MARRPQELGEMGRAWGHSLIAVEGNFLDVVWKCEHCGTAREKKEHFRNVECV